MFRYILPLACFAAAAAVAQVAEPGRLPPVPVAGTLDGSPVPDAVAERLHDFDPAKVQCAWQNRRWLLVCDGRVLKDFGPSEQEARLAHRLISELRLSQLGTVGTPDVVMEYWLADGRAPAALTLPGLRTMPLDAARMRVEQVQGQWCLKDATRTLFAFGGSKADAEKALAVVRRHGFDAVGVVGQVRPTMYVFFRQAGASAAGGGSNAGRAMAASKFSRVVKNKDGSVRTEFRRTDGGPATGDIPKGVVQPLLPAPNTAAGLEKVGAVRWHSQPHVNGFVRMEGSDRIGFDWRQATVVQDERGWNVMAGQSVLLNFGTHGDDARLALQAIRHYRFAEARHVGGDRPYLKVFICPAATARAAMLGLAGVSFAADKLESRKDGETYVIASEDRVVARLRDERDAEGLLQSLKAHRCNHVSRIGEPGGETMTIFARTR